MTREVLAAAFGSPDVLEVRETTVPDPGPGQVVVDLRAIGVNPVDFKIYGGTFGTDESTLPLRLGSEAAGVVVAVGTDARGPGGPVSVGDHVIVTAEGTYADRVLVDADDVVPKPDGLGWNEAAGLLSVAGTAFDTVETVAVRSGDTVLVHGASGAVGSIVVQLALARGAAAIGTSGERNLDAVRALGATAIFYGTGLEGRIRDAAPHGVSAVVDTVGNDEAVDVSLALAPDRARIVTITAFERAQRDGFGFVGGPNPTSRQRRRAARLDLAAAAGRGEIAVTVARTFALSDAAIAHSELNGPHPRGKFVLLPSS